MSEKQALFAEHDALRDELFEVRASLRERNRASRFASREVERAEAGVLALSALPIDASYLDVQMAFWRAVAEKWQLTAVEECAAEVTAVERQLEIIDKMNAIVAKLRESD